MGSTALGFGAFALAWVLFSAPVFAGEGSYLKAPPAISKLLDAEPPPNLSLDPTGKTLLLSTTSRYPPIADLAAPFVRLAGVRIDTSTNGLQGALYTTNLRLQRVPDGVEVPVGLPPGSRVLSHWWNPSGENLALMVVEPAGLSLWVAEAGSGRARRLKGVKLNPVLGSPVAWLADRRTLLVRAVPSSRGAVPSAPRAPTGPNIQSSQGVTKQSSTYEARDLLKTEYDATLFEYYATTQLELVDSVTGTLTPVGAPGVLSRVAPAPNGQLVLVERIQRPYSYLRPYGRFASRVELVDLVSKRLEWLADLPLAEQVPVRGVRTGPRDFAWRPTAPATLVWAEALDDGDLANKVPHRDRLMVKRAGAPPTEWLKVATRFDHLDFVEGGGLVFVHEYDDDRHWKHVVLHDFDDPAFAPRPVWDLSRDEKYAAPGALVYRQLPSGAWAVAAHDGAVLLSGAGASTDGNRPFLDSLDLKTLATTRWFRSERTALENVVGVVNQAERTVLTYRQSPTEVPNAWLRRFTTPVDGPVPAGESQLRSTAKQVTRTADPMPELRAVTKQLVTYTRADGTPLSMKVYLPPGYRAGTALPTVLWAYPLDYTDAKQAGQVDGSDKNFLFPVGPTPVWFALHGYAVLDEVAMPVVGPVETAYDSFIEQVTQNAQAALDQAVALGVTDRDRVGVMGHSHGALMTVTLLAHTDLFRAGVARSGAYNHTLRPFGFQNEHRSLYQAKDTYLRLSPLLWAPKINEPLLLIHGELDVNPGTVPLQSERLYDAVRGVGGTVRLVMLPLESHGYSARESVEQVIAEQLRWFDDFVKNAPPRDAGPATRQH